MTDFSETRGGCSNDPVAIKANAIDWRVRSRAFELADKNWGGVLLICASRTWGENKKAGASTGKRAHYKTGWLQSTASNERL